MNPTNPNASSQVNDLQAAASSLGLQIAVVGASTPKEIDDAFGQLAEHEIPGLVVTADGFLVSRQDQLLALAAGHSVPAIYPLSCPPFQVAGERVRGFLSSACSGFCRAGQEARSS